MYWTTTNGRKTLWRAFLALQTLLIVSSIASAQVEVGSAVDQVIIQDQALYFEEKAYERNRAMEMGRQMFGFDERCTGAFVNQYGMSNEERKKLRNELAGTLNHKYATDVFIDDWGCFDETLTSLSKVSDTEALVMGTRQKVFLLRGFDMDRFIGGRKFVLQHPVVVSGTYTYTTTIGAESTVLVLEKDEKKLLEAGKRLYENRKLRKWTDATGQYTTEADFIQFKRGAVVLEKRDGTQITIPMLKLSKEDQRYVRDLLTRESEKPKSLYAK